MSGGAGASRACRASLTAGLPNPSRRAFVGALGAAIAASAGAGAAATQALATSASSKAGDAPRAGAGLLPVAAPDPESPFGVDLGVNMDTIDDYLHLDGVAYRDMRMLRDPADYASIGGDSLLSIALEGFKVVPFPYIGTLQELPVSGAYDGDRLFDVTWADDGTVASATPRYEQADLIIADLFPRDEPIILCCGGGGYAGMMRQLLIFFGYDPAKLYNAGGVWDYTGYYPVELARYDAASGTTSYFSWRVDCAPINFDELDPTA